MLRIAYISGEKETPQAKPKQQTKNSAFMEEVRQAIETRCMLDEQRAIEMFAPEMEELEKLKTTLNKLKNKRDEILQ